MTETDQQHRNSEAKFASPDGDNVGIGYYFDGEEVSPEEFSEKVAQRGEEIRAERAEARDE